MIPKLRAKLNFLNSKRDYSLPKLTNLGEMLKYFQRDKLCHIRKREYIKDYGYLMKVFISIIT